MLGSENITALKEFTHQWGEIRSNEPIIAPVKTRKNKFRVISEASVRHAQSYVNRGSQRKKHLNLNFCSMRGLVMLEWEKLRFRHLGHCTLGHIASKW